MTSPEHIEARVEASLDHLGVAGLGWIDIDPQCRNDDDLSQQYGYDLSHSANIIIVASKRGRQPSAAASCWPATG